MRFDEYNIDNNDYINLHVNRVCNSFSDDRIVVAQSEAFERIIEACEFDFERVFEVLYVTILIRKHTLNIVGIDNEVVSSIVKNQLQGVFTTRGYNQPYIISHLQNDTEFGLKVARYVHYQYINTQYGSDPELFLGLSTQAYIKSILMVLKSIYNMIYINREEYDADAMISVFQYILEFNNVDMIDPVTRSKLPIYIDKLRYANSHELMMFFYTKNDSNVANSVTKINIMFDFPINTYEKYLLQIMAENILGEGNMSQILEVIDDELTSNSWITSNSSYIDPDIVARNSFVNTIIDSVLYNVYSNEASIVTTLSIAVITNDRINKRLVQNA